jgi:HTH-type transcriptional regulator / antitoxin HigA
MTTATKPFLKPVRNERDHRSALKRARALMLKGKRNQHERDELHLLGLAIQHYEETHFKRYDCSPADVLRSLVEDAGHKQKDIAEGTGIAASTISEILHGKREINARQAVALGKYFGVRADAFLPRS